MKKKYRLIKVSDFKLVFDSQKKIKTDCLICHYRKDRTLENIKIGIIIPKKKCKSSVNRNYLKRVLWFFNQSKTLSQLPKFKCILMFTKHFFENYDIDNLPIEIIKKRVEKIHTNLINLSNNV